MSTAPDAPPVGFLLFHLNLGFSTLEVADRPTVIRACYEPLLDLVETGGRPVAIELTGWTLVRLEELAPEWVGRLKALVAAGRVEIVGSGWAQVIGPLAPADINRWNQALGREAYERTFGAAPHLALVNEMAFSSGLVDVHAEAGYVGLVLDRENVRAALGVEDDPPARAPAVVRGTAGASLPVVWSDTVLFQRFQRVVHGEIRLDDYLAAIGRRIADGQRVLPIYTNDVEVFGYRPGRFMTEATLATDEWHRIVRVLEALESRFDLAWSLPSDLLPDPASEPAVSVTDAANPILVKKQRKYNVNRWALSGRDDLRLNTAAHRLARLADTDELRREACEWWASDLRTHLAEDRWQELRTRLDAVIPVDAARSPSSSVLAASNGAADPDGPDLELRTDAVEVRLDSRRGGTVRTLAFRSHGWEPCFGLVPQGRVPALDVLADFYTGGAVVDLPGASRRLTDLEPCRPVRDDDADVLRTRIVAGRGLDGSPLTSSIIEVPRGAEEMRLTVDLGRVRPHGSVRVAHLTLLPDAFPGALWVETALGGAAERLPIDRDVDHGAPVSLLVSSSTSLGGGSGEVRLGDRQRAVRITWDPAACAAVPMLHHRRVGDAHLTRLVFSLAELDDTFRDGGMLLPLTVTISPV